jgi:excisionase family DNA binding protein
MLSEGKMSTKNQAHGVGNDPCGQSQLKLLTLKEVAAYARVSMSTVRRWVRDEGLPFYKAGRQKRVDETELVRFLCGNELRFL